MKLSRIVQFLVDCFTRSNLISYLAFVPVANWLLFLWKCMVLLSKRKELGVGCSPPWNNYYSRIRHYFYLLGGDKPGMYQQVSYKSPL